MGKHDDDDSDEHLTFAPDLPQGISKEPVRRAESDAFARPRGSDEVTIHYVILDKVDGQVFESTRESNEPVTFYLNRGKVVDGWEKSLVTMRRGELSRFTMKREHMLGAEGALPSKIPESDSIVCEIELVDFARRKDLFKDGQVMKKTILQGSRFEKAKADGEGIISYKVLGTDGAMVEERSRLEYKFGSNTLGHLGEIFNQAICNMKPGGLAAIECAADHPYCEGRDSTVTIELTLEELYKTDDVSWFKNGTLLKKRIRLGEDSRGPEEGDNVTLLVEAATDGSDPLPGFKGPTVLDFTWGDGEVAEVFEAATLKMTKGERALLLCNDLDICCEEKLGLSKIDAKKVGFTVELQDFQAETQEILAPDAEGKLEFAATRKDVGARLFKEQRWLMAFYRYEFVVKFLHEKFTDRKGEHKQKVEELITACQLNQAACLLKYGDFQGAVRAATLVLDRHPSNVKALFRRGSAHHSRAEYMDAIRDLRQAVQYDPKNIEARKMLQAAQEAQKDEDKTAKSMFAKMVVKEEDATPSAA